MFGKILTFVEAGALALILSSAAFSILPPLPLLASSGGGTRCCSTYCPTNPEAVCDCDGEASCVQSQCLAPPYVFPFNIRCQSDT